MNTGMGPIDDENMADDDTVNLACDDTSDSANNIATDNMDNPAGEVAAANIVNIADIDDSNNCNNDNQHSDDDETQSQFMTACVKSKIPSFEQITTIFNEWLDEARDEYRRSPKMTLGLQWALVLRYPFMYPDTMAIDNEQSDDIVAAVSKAAHANHIKCDIDCGYIDIPSSPLALVKKQGVAVLDDSDDMQSVWTFFDDFPHGWLAQFGIEMLEDLRNALLFEDGEERLLSYRIMQIKEKYGSLRFYANTDSDITSDIQSCYEAISYLCCIDCGSFAHVRLTHGWVTPVCYDCWNRQYNGRFNKFIECTSPGAPNGARDSMGYTVYSTDGQRDVNLYEIYIGKDAKRFVRYGDAGEDETLTDSIKHSDKNAEMPLHVADVYQRYIEQMNG